MQTTQEEIFYSHDEICKIGPTIWAETNDFALKDGWTIREVSNGFFFNPNFEARRQQHPQV
jgi:hypothetical protein